MIITKQTPLNKILELGKECQKCGHCCMHSSGFVSKDEIKKLAKHFKTREKQSFSGRQKSKGFFSVKENIFIKKYLDETVIFNGTVYKFKTRKTNGRQYGTCILYSKGCTIHRIKPLHCRVGNCNKHGEELSAWFTVNYLVNPTNPESIRQFKLYIDSGGKTLKQGELKDLVKDKKILKKILSYEVLK